MTMGIGRSSRVHIALAGMVLVLLVLAPPSAVGSCLTSADCSDGLFCNGAEVCVANQCQAGAPPSIDDGITCTVDSCDEANDLIVHTPVNAVCGDGVFCNGEETCNVNLGCVSGTPLAIDDGIACTSDSCDEANDLILHTPVNATCNDGVFCNGTEICNPASGCQSGANPCNDGNACTTDSCNEAMDTCSHGINTYAESCYTGPLGTEGVGACQAGIQTCSGGAFGACVGETTPAADDSACNGIDDDCDGMVDEDFGGASTGCGVGACASTGQLICQGGVVVDTCIAGMPSAEVCDLADNDCDGVVDDFCTGSTGPTVFQFM